MNRVDGTMTPRSSQHSGAVINSVGEKFIFQYKSASTKEADEVSFLAHDQLLFLEKVIRRETDDPPARTRQQ